MHTSVYRGGTGVLRAKQEDAVSGGASGLELNQQQWVELTRDGV